MARAVLHHSIDAAMCLPAAMAPRIGATVTIGKNSRAGAGAALIVRRAIRSTTGAENLEQEPVPPLARVREPRSQTVRREIVLNSDPLQIVQPTGPREPSRPIVQLPTGLQRDPRNDPRRDPRNDRRNDRQRGLPPDRGHRQISTAMRAADSREIGRSTGNAMSIGPGHRRKDSVRVADAPVAVVVAVAGKFVNWSASVLQ